MACRLGQGNFAHLLCCLFDGIHNISVACTSTDDCRHGFSYFFSGRRRINAQKIQRGVEHSRRAEAALKPVLLMKGLLQRMKFSVLRQPLDSADLTAIGLDCKHDTGSNGFSVEQDCARSADAMLATDVGPCEREIFPQKIGKQLAGFTAALTWRAVHGKLDINEGVHQFFALRRWPRAEWRGPRVPLSDAGDSQLNHSGPQADLSVQPPQRLMLSR
jgi:hypothetical protein